MTAEFLARLQFAFTIMFHYIYPPLSIGLGMTLVLMEALWLKTGDILYHNMARFWTRVFALTFAIGVATGIVMEFEFGTNWATYSRFASRWATSFAASRSTRSTSLPGRCSGSSIHTRCSWA